MATHLRTLIALSIVPQIVLVKIIGSFPGFVETYYSTGLYPIISKIARYVFGWIPFSVGDLIYSIAAVFLIRFLIKELPQLFKKPMVLLRECLVVISVLYALFHMLWGFNYYRLPLHEKLHLSELYTQEELYHYTNYLIQQSNAIHKQLSADSTAMIKIPYSKEEIYKKSLEGYQKLSQQYPDLKLQAQSIKTSLYSTGLTYMGYGGYLNPFTNEAQVNGLQINYRYPIVSCHEQAHQIGYSAENEANFIGFLAATHNTDKYFQYSGYLYVLRYALAAVKRKSPEQFEVLKKQLYPGIIKNYIQVDTFWKKHKTKAEPYFKKTFNSFLKANNQKKGIKSYSYVVALLVNYHKAQHKKTVSIKFSKAHCFNHQPVEYATPMVINTN